MRVSIAKPEPDEARAAALRPRQTVDQDGEEDDVVDAEDDLEHRQRQEGQPGLRIGEQFHRDFIARASHGTGRAAARPRLLGNPSTSSGLVSLRSSRSSVRSPRSRASAAEM